MSAGLLAETRAEWSAVYRLLLLAEADAAARTVPCRDESSRTPCGAREGEGCRAVTGLMASAPHEVRAADAEAAGKESATGRGVAA